ncbi:MAG: efflux RND transporter permease subunit [Aphanocapsa lilacina HA4352-LM1]|jgi:multidrug efflux pump subunit AcrB|nr:efflux RND transporter permease subunit [Aphanocapsa lilacina HA4352-LM1]
MAGQSLRERWNISRLALKHPWLTLGFWAALSVIGVFAFGSLKYALFPDITFPVIVVNSSHASLSAEDTEANLTRPIEQRLKNLAGVDKVRSQSYPGQSVVSLALAVGTDLEAAKREAQTALAQTALPADATYQVFPVNLNESAAASYAIESDTLDLDSLAKVAAARIVPALQKVPGVLRVTLLGERGLADKPTAVRFGGRDALAVQIVKRERANTLEVVRSADQEVERLRRELAGIDLRLAATQADYIREASQATVEALVLAVALSVLVIFPFLGSWRATFISALAIPTSLLGTFIVMALLGFNLETITLLALALVIGIIIDDAIVDVENIARHLDDGEPPYQAAVSATDEIGLTVTAATLTIVAVFLPVGLMGGVLGQFFRPFGITVSAAVLTSLLVARTLSPLLASRWLKAHSPRAANIEAAWQTGWLRRYRRILSWALDHRQVVVGLALASFVAGLALIPLIPKGFIPHLDRGEFNVRFAAALGTPVEDSLAVARQLEGTVRSFPDVAVVFTTVGERGASHRGVLYVKLREERTLRTFDLQDQLRARLPAIEAADVSVEDMPFVDNGAQKPLEVALLGPDLEPLQSAAAALKERLAAQPGFADLAVGGAGQYEGLTVEISHLGGERVVYLSSNLSRGLTIGEATDRVNAAAKTVLPAGVRLSFGGDAENVSNVFGGFAVTLVLSVVCILGVLLWLFRSWTDPLVVLLSLPLSVVGAMLAQFVTRSDFGMISVIGIIFLLGLVNKNAIILVDYINQLRAGGLPTREAILQAGPIRLRPILMTTAAAILGMLPIALGLGAGAELRAPMAIAIIGGLLTSTLLSLIVVPVAYSLFAPLKGSKYSL